MYYLNEDGKRVYTLKVRDDDDVNDYQSAARFLFLFLSSFVRGNEMWRFVDLRRVVVVVVCWNGRRRFCWLFVVSEFFNSLSDDFLL